jgi:hypothetical protein
METNSFKLPIYYNSRKQRINPNIITDLEMLNTHETNEKNIYTYVFNGNENVFSKPSELKISEYYTDDIHFLKDSQQLLQKYVRVKQEDESLLYSDMFSLWNEVKTDTNFKEKYFYVTWSMFEQFNSSESFLQIMSVYNISSPLFFLISPIIMLIIPFIILKCKGIKIDLNEYLNILKIIAKDHAINKIFTQFEAVSTEERFYNLLIIAFYFFSVYQNIQTCLKFHKNMKQIHTHLFVVRKYIHHSLENMKNYLTHSHNLPTYNAFNNDLESNVKTLTEFYTQLESIQPYSFSCKTLSTLGHVLKNFYDLYKNTQYTASLLYSFSFNGYLTNIEGLRQNINLKNMNFAKLTNKKQKNKIKQNYYASLVNSQPVKNDIVLNGGLCISGPNASGKTTLLKSVLINIILTQQFGCGFYTSAKLKPYTYLHSYLNIPDTSGRDSLFQAESRRCKEIIDSINTFKHDSHFCSFDELFSGTNPEEAEVSSISFMNYIMKHNNVCSMLTTHFINVCKTLDSNSKIKNYQMKTTHQNDKHIYHYLLNSGISQIRGGIQILREMEYPKEMLNDLSQIDA